MQGLGPRDGAAGKEAALISVGLRGFARNVDRGIGFDEARKLGAFGPDIPDFKEPTVAEGALDVEVPVLRVRQAEVRIEREQRHGLGEAAGEGITAVERIVEAGKLRCEVCRYGGALLGACKGPP